MSPVCREVPANTRTPVYTCQSWTQGRAAPGAALTAGGTAARGGPSQGSLALELLSALLINALLISGKCTFTQKLVSEH